MAFSYDRRSPQPHPCRERKLPKSRSCEGACSTLPPTASASAGTSTLRYARCRRTLVLMAKSSPAHFAPALPVRFDMNYILTGDHRQIQDLIRRVAKDKVAPRANEIDHTAEYPSDMYALLKELGLFALPFPAEYGGTGSMLSACI